MKFDKIKPTLAVLRQLAYLKLTKRRMPVFVGLQVTNLCNLRCAYCFAELNSLKGKTDLATQQWKEIINELHEMGARWIRVSGGEPLMRKDIGEIINYIKDRGMICEMVTNGILLKEHINSLTRLDSLCISLDGNQQENDQYRGQGAYEGAIEAIKLAKALKIKLRIHGVLARHNINSLEYMAKLCKSLGVGFNVAYFHLNEKKNINGLSLDHNEIEDYYKQYRYLKEEGFPIVSSYVFIDHILNWPQDRGEPLVSQDIALIKKHNLISCLAGRYSCFVDSDGGMYACPKRWKEGINISQGLKKAWEALSNHDCVSCRAYGDNEVFTIMDFNPEAIWNVLSYFVKDGI